MKVASWNVNSVRARLEHVHRWIDAVEPDVLALQETKVVDDAFPADGFAARGYHVAYAGQKSYNGVAILSRSPLQDVSRELEYLGTEERRMIAATIDGIRLVNVYVVNGQSVGSEKFEHKLEWLDALRRQIEMDRVLSEDILVLGDFNIAPEDRDVYDPDRWRDRILCSSPERQRLEQLLALGLVDTFRLFTEDGGHYSWWDYRAGSFSRNRGLRIDLILASGSLAERCTDSAVDEVPRSWAKPSDHAPVVATFRNA